MIKHMIYSVFLFHYLFAIEVGVASERASGASKGKHGKRNRDGNVHADLDKHNIIQRSHGRSIMWSARSATLYPAWQK